MTRGFEPDWSAVVCARLDALFASADAGFVRSSPRIPVRGHAEDMLWEADAMRFAERYPESGIVESYGPQWPASCIDYWVYVDVESRRATLSTEGWTGEQHEVPLSGDGADDASRIAEVLARILEADA